MTIDMTTCSKDRSIELRTMDISCEVVRKTNTSPADEERKAKRENCVFLTERRAQDYCFSFPPFSLTLTSKTKTPRPPKDHSREGGAKSHPAPEEGAQPFARYSCSCAPASYRIGRDGACTRLLLDGQEERDENV